MKQVLVKGGGVAVEDVPAPAVEPRGILVRVTHSCVSVGTELTNVELSGLPLSRRALKQREHAKRVFEIARNEGFARTYKRVRGLLQSGLPTGYSAAGVVVEVGNEVEAFAPGDYVACAGAGIANHAELISVPVNLAVHVPDGLSTADASTVTLGAIALQGVRRADPTLGETVGIIGLGVLGQLTAQLLRANGCRVIGSDVDEARVGTALELGMWKGVVAAEADFAERVRAVTDGFGADAVIVTAATSSDEVVHEAFQACRRKGRVVLVGDVGLALRRSDLYEKELDFRISTSYGPGRYDPVYEDDGHDYPIGYVRWTENRNMQEYVQLLATGSVRLEGLGGETYPIDRADDAYAALRREGSKPLLVVLEYPERDQARGRTARLRELPRRDGAIRVALIGAGGFAQATHLPNLLRLRNAFQLRAVASRTGASAKAVADRNEAAYATTDVDEVLTDDDVDLVLVSTRHDLHARLVLRALEAGKHVFVEKPLALTEDELSAIESFYAAHPDGPLLLTGFNRRFSPAIMRARELVAGRATPLVVDYRMNAGFIPPDSWVHGPEGGGRNIGEACHVYDVFIALTGSTELARVDAHGIQVETARLHANDNFVATMTFGDGSVCALTYTALGHRDHPKERMEIYADGTVLTLDDYKALTVTGRKANGWRGSQDKGHFAELQALARALREGGPWPITLEEQLVATRISFAVERGFAGNTE